MAKKRKAKKAARKSARSKPSRTFTATVKLKVDRDGVKKNDIRQALQESLSTSTWTGTQGFELVPMREGEPAVPVVGPVK